MSTMTLKDVSRQLRNLASDGMFGVMADVIDDEIAALEKAVQPAEQPRVEARSKLEPDLVDLITGLRRHQVVEAVKRLLDYIDTAAQPKPEQAVGDGVDMQAIAAAVNAVGAEIDGGDSPDAQTGYPGYGACFTFDEKQITEFVAMVREWGASKPPAASTDFKEHYLTSLVTAAQRAAVAKGAPSHDARGNLILRTEAEANEMLRNGYFDPR